jgi:hypothetical protein
VHIIPIQIELKVYYPPIQGNKDYLKLKNLLARIDLILHEGGIERKAIELKMEEDERKLSYQQKMNFQKNVIKALRCNIVKELSGLSFRDLSVRLSDSLLLQRFCDLISIDKVCVPGKSSLAH